MGTPKHIPFVRNSSGPDTSREPLYRNVTQNTDRCPENIEYIRCIRCIRSAGALSLNLRSRSRSRSALACPPRHKVQRNAVFGNRSPEMQPRILTVERKIGIRTQCHDTKREPFFRNAEPWDSHRAYHNHQCSIIAAWSRGEIWLKFLFLK